MLILIIHHRICFNLARNNRIVHISQVILYVGLGMISVGLVITFVGLGEKGFKTLELKLIGPSLVGCGVFFALLRVLFCTLPSCCRSFLQLFFKPPSITPSLFRSCMKRLRKSEDAQKLLTRDQVSETVENIKNIILPTQERPRDAHILRAGNGVAAFHGAENHQQQRTPDLGQHGGRFYPQRHEVSRAPYGTEMSRGNPPRDPRGDPQMGDQQQRRSHRRDLVEGEGGVARLRGGGGGVVRDNNHPSSANPAYDLSAPAGRTPLEGSTKRLKTGEILLNATRLNGPSSGLQ